MKAILENLRSSGVGKDRIGFFKQISAIDPKTGREVASARFYQPGTTVYCRVWINGPEMCGSGCGSAGGYGYHKASAALESALDSAGVLLSERISGVGESAMLRAVEAIAQAATGKRKFIIHTAHE